LNIESDGKIHRHQLADTMIAMVKPIPSDDSEDGRWERMEAVKPAKKSLFDW